mgnify:CR=1 FL=1
MPQFKIEQLALAITPAREAEAMKFLAACGIKDWTTDMVHATGVVRGQSCRNVASLKFNYGAFAGNELELLRYAEGENWLNRIDLPAVSHIGMHIEEEDLAAWRSVMADFGIPLAQEVWTDSHTNSRIANCRRYHYVIFGTRDLIGVDMKFIVRRIINQTEENRQLAKIASAQ